MSGGRSRRGGTIFRSASGCIWLHLAAGCIWGGVRPASSQPQGGVEDEAVVLLDEVGGEVGIERTLNAARAGDAPVPAEIGLIGPAVRVFEPEQHPRV